MTGDTPDFSGWATKENILCTDGRTIMKDAFAHQDGVKVPLLWKHNRKDPKAVLGYAILEAAPGGSISHCYFNDSDEAKSAKAAISHGDINSLSIYATRLLERGKSVMHGFIEEVSLVFKGANSGAKIIPASISHGDRGEELIDGEAYVEMGLPLIHHDVGEGIMADEDANLEHETDHQRVFDSMNKEQKDLLSTLLGTAVAAATATHEDNDSSDNADAEHSDDGEADGSTDADKQELNHQEGSDMGTKTLFDNKGKQTEGGTLSHEAQVEMASSIFKRAKTLGSSREAIREAVLEHGIESIETLFPDAKAVSDRPEFLARRQEWVNIVINGARHTPFARIKSLHADLTMDEARAKGYIKGAMKLEEFIKVAKRVTLPKTIYKKQKLDRDDILDITDFDVVAWLRGEMKLMWEEEVARAILLGDGRAVDHPDKIDEENIRPIAKDHELYATTVFVPVDETNSSREDVIDAVVLNRKEYRGSGNPTWFTSETELAKMLLIKDTLGRRIYPALADLAAALRVSSIVTVEPMEAEENIIGIMVNMQDYTIGTDKGGQQAMFDDFDIDYNQYTYLLEGRMSGALTKVKSALVIRKVAVTAVLITPKKPTFTKPTHVISGLSDANQTFEVSYDGGSSFAAVSSDITLTPAKPEAIVRAVPKSGHYFETNAHDEFTFKYSA